MSTPSSSSASFPNKQIRTKCYAARDALWKCLDKNNDKVESCKELRKMFESDCPAIWVPHFDRKREYEKFKKKIETDGFEPILDEEKNKK